MALSYRFTGPDHQVVAASGGHVFVRVWDAATLVALQDAALDPVRVTVTGPWTGGEGLEDATSAYYAALAVVPGWSFTGDVPVVPEIPPWSPDVVYSPPPPAA
ncbi:hypothetical protein [Dietzia natronolimnaea]|uniref:hypothetical protein n=1 Tax=Dietzia natronolimnaea TaxID=161920 RepID=UPI0015F81F10|nr:hypothetical protein [Dietzia natronolimnaea]MBB1037844.1 hypothetical protein [Dietzia natronolimnaea]